MAWVLQARRIVRTGAGGPPHKGAEADRGSVGQDLRRKRYSALFLAKPSSDKALSFSPRTWAKPSGWTWSSRFVPKTPSGWWPKTRPRRRWRRVPRWVDDANDLRGALNN